MRLAEGRINFRVREIREGDLYEVDTPNLAFTVKQAGAFHVDVNENGDTTGVTVIRGEGEVAAGGQTYTVHAGERATITGTDNSVQYNVNAAPLNPDEFDKWADQRDYEGRKFHFRQICFARCRRVTATWTITAIGKKNRLTGMCGIRIR